MIVQPGGKTSVYPAPSNSEGSGPASRKKWFPVLCFLIVTLSTVIEIGCLNNALVIDDLTLVFNGDERGCGENPIDCFSGKLFHLYYRPMLTASFAAVQRFHIHDNSPQWFHMENLLLHAAVTALALWLFRLILRRRTAALVAGALFALHPVQVCVTAFIGGRTDTLALFFLFLFAIGLHRAGTLLRVGRRSKSARHTRRALLWIALSVPAFLAAIFTKEQVIPLVLVTPLLVNPNLRMVLSRKSVDVRRRAGYTQPGPPWWLVIYLAPILIFTMASSRVLKGDSLPHADWTNALHVEMVGRTLWYFAKTFFAPTVTTLHQSTLGAWDVPQRGVELLGYLAAALWMLLLARVWSSRRLRTLGLWATLTLFSCINLIPIPSQFASPYRAAIPLFGIAGLAGSVIAERSIAFWRRLAPSVTENGCRAVSASLLCAFFAWCIVTSMVDVPMWKDETQLMKAEVAADPNYIPARAALANDYSFDQPPDYNASLKEYNICVQQLFGANTPTDRYAALILSPQMVRTMRSASGLRYGPEWYLPPLIRGRGGAFHNLHRYDEAIENYKVVLAVTPKDTDTRTALVSCYAILGEECLDGHDYQGAIAQFKAGLIADPDNRSTRDSLIAAYRMSGQKSKADAVFRMEDRFTGVVP